MPALRSSIISAAGIVLALNVNTPAVAQSLLSYVPNSLDEAAIFGGPWTLHQESGANAHDASGILPSIATPYNPPTTAFGTPYKDYCVNGKVQTAFGSNPMQPYYFPFVRKSRDGRYLEGLFDYRPRNEQEAVVAAISLDWGRNWVFQDEALALNPYCPADATDPDNNNVIVNGASTAYASNSNNAADNGLGHSFTMTVNGHKFLYQLNRANGHIDSDPFVVHQLASWESHPLASLPTEGYESPLASMGYPTLEATAKATTGLQHPDAILGSLKIDGVTTIVYVAKQLSVTLPTAQTCPKTPSWALTNNDTGKARKANTDVITIRIATTTDGINFTDVGPASGLQDPFSVALNAIRWLGSGSIIRLTNGHYGMFFGAGNCLDNDSDGFHFLGYAETVAPVRSPADLLNWKVIYGFDNPILSTDSVTDPVAHVTYPANAPLIDATSVDALSAAEVSPWVPPGAFNKNFFSGRVYDPQAIATSDSVVTIVFAGYNTPQPSSNLGDYRTIGRFQVRFPDGYVAFDRDDRDSFDRDHDDHDHHDRR